MDILLISATSAEIAPLIAHLKKGWQQQSEWIFTNDKNQLQIFITSVGMTATTYGLTKMLQQKAFDFVMQAGIGGSFDRNIPLGEVVLIESEMFGDLGAEDHYNFLDIFELNLADANEFPFNNKQLKMPPVSLHQSINLPRVSALSINTVSGTSFTATARIKKYNCQVESMEGAAFHYVCLKENIPFAQIRAISNYVEARDKSKWKMKEAITNLNVWIIDFINRV